jgi:hypothetical protein
MATTLTACARLLTQDGIRHHVDAGEQVLRAVFATQDYENLRGEKIAIVTLATADGGRRVRASIARAFPVADDPAAACLACCRLAADTPLVGVEYDPDRDDLRLVVETTLEDGRLTKLQLFSMLDGLVQAAEAWHVGLRVASARRRAGRSRAKRAAA